ncbi:MAG: GNAT family N-acetyltransferase [Verrucomicrobia bacterium]|nr:GNAT family N-acetyltransferase [Verrucomicrobiota bacterium]
MQSEVTLRPANQGDMPFLLDLRQQTMNPYVIASGLTPSTEELLQRILFRFDCARIVQLAGEAVGLLKVARDGKDWYLIQIQLRPAFQGQGLGSQLIRSVIDEALTEGASLSLHVRKVNPARRLYERLGFIVVEESTHAYKMRLLS